MNTLVEMLFGSHLYGTNTPNSDKDYKGVFLPKIEELITGIVQHNYNSMTKKGEQKNTKDDIDTEFYSLHSFLELGFAGETVFIDMIHARDTIIQTSPVWEELYKQRSRFYTSNMKSYLGYCKSQAAKYGVKGSRLNDVKLVLDILSKQPLDSKLLSIVDSIQETEHIKKVVKQDHLNGDNRFLNVCGKEFQYTSNIEHIIPSLSKFYNNYGQRAKLAAQNEGIDRKAISHAFRAGFQLEEIYTTGDLKYPLKQRERLTDVKLGKLHFVNDGIGEQLDLLIERCGKLSDNSGLPKEVDREYRYDYLISLYIV